MLKRLNFLKSSLEAHSPRETTNSLRIKAVKRRDERVVEIWKRDMEAPTVSEILQNYKHNRQLNQIDLSSDNLYSSKE